MIKPTVGRKVWFIPSLADITADGYKILPDPVDSTKTQPLDATILAVHSDTNVNLFIIDAEGGIYHHESCFLVQDGVYPTDPNVSYAEWMPYQLAQSNTPTVAPVTGTVA